MNTHDPMEIENDGGSKRSADSGHQLRKHKQKRMRLDSALSMHLATIQHLSLAETSKAIQHGEINEESTLEQDRYGRYMLHYAAMSDQNAERKCFMLINHCNADPNLQDYEGNTPLHLAAAKNDLQLCQLLLSNGARASVANHKGETITDLIRPSPDFRR